MKTCCGVEPELRHQPTSDPCGPDGEAVQYFFRCPRCGVRSGDANSQAEAEAAWESLPLYEDKKMWKAAVWVVVVGGGLMLVLAALASGK